MVWQQQREVDHGGRKGTGKPTTKRGRLRGEGRGIGKPTTRRGRLQVGGDQTRRENSMRYLKLNENTF